MEDLKFCKCKTTSVCVSQEKNKNGEMPFTHKKKQVFLINIIG